MLRQMMPEKIAANEIIQKLLERQGAHNPVNVARCVSMEQEALTIQPEIIYFAEFMMAYGYDVAVICPPGKISSQAKSLEHGKSELKIVNDNLSLWRLQTDGFPVLRIGHKEKYGLNPLMHLAPEDPFFAMGSEFWMGSMAKARGVINRPINIVSITPNPDYL